MRHLRALKPHEWISSDFYLDVYLRPVKPPVNKDLVQGSFGIALAHSLYQHGITGSIWLFHDITSEFLRIAPTGPIILARSLTDRILSGEIIWYGIDSPAYRILSMSFLEDRRFPIIPPDGPHLIDLINGVDPMNLKDKVISRMRMLSEIHGVDMIISKDIRLAEILDKKRMSYSEAEKYVEDLLKDILNGL